MTNRQNPTTNVIELNTPSARAYYAAPKAIGKNGILVPFGGLTAPKLMVDSALKRIEMHSTALEIFAAHPELRSLCERAAMWMTDYFPAERPDQLLLDECLRHALDAYLVTSSPRAKRNEPLKAFVTRFAHHAVLMCNYSVGCRTQNGSYDRNIWSFLSEPLHAWLEAKTPKEIEFKAIDRLKYGGSTHLARTFLSCQIVDYATLSILEDGTVR